MSPVRPLPRVVVELDGAPLAAEDAHALGEVLVQQRLSLPALCELRFFDPRGALGMGSTLPAGAALRVTVRGHAEPLFAGQVTAAEYVYGPAHERELRVRGYDLLHQLRKRRPVRAHVQVSLLDLARDLVAGRGIAVAAAEPGPFLHKLIQHRQSDLELLAEAGERCGLYLTLRGDVLHLLTLQGLGPPLPLVLGQSLLEARFEVNGDPACRSVSAVGWDPARVESHQGKAKVARVGRRVAAAVPPERVGGSGERSLVNQALQDDRQAEALAQAELDAGVAREVTLEGVAEGDPRLRPGTRVEVRGVAAALTGSYVLTAVTHTCDARKGFVSQIDTAPPPSRLRATGATATLGVVTQLDDPERMGRVRVSLPAYGNVETDWLGVLAAGGGAGKGLMALPDVGDQVLVLFAQEDTAQGVVLGGLYGVPGPPDSGLEGGAVRRYTLLTPGGQRLRLDDGRQLIRIENSDGSYVELAPDRVRLHARRDLEIEAPGRAVVIRGRSIDFERG